ncbi:MAG: asparaginase, partial [Ornithinimicrobium sp.]
MSRLTELAGAPVVATVTRSGLVESVHHGMVVATDASGAVIFGVGPHDIPIYPRSANKPMQSIAMLRSSLLLDGGLLSLASASHNGEQMHLDGVRSILSLADEGLTEDDLVNTPDYPLDEHARIYWMAQGRGPSSIAQNCSGKHAAMLLTCIASGWDTTTYLDPDHRLQRAMAETIEEFSGEPVAGVGVDGCGAPA